MKFRNQSTFKGQSITGVLNKPLMRKKGKRWIVISLSALMLLGIGGMASTHASANTNTVKAGINRTFKQQAKVNSAQPSSSNQSAKSSANSSSATSAQSGSNSVSSTSAISNSANALHNSLLRNSVGSQRQNSVKTSPEIMTALGAVKTGASQQGDARNNASAQGSANNSHNSSDDNTLNLGTKANQKRAWNFVQAGVKGHDFDNSRTNGNGRNKTNAQQKPVGQTEQVNEPNVGDDILSQYDKSAPDHAVSILHHILYIKNATVNGSVGIHKLGFDNLNGVGQIRAVGNATLSGDLAKSFAGMRKLSAVTTAPGANWDTSKVTGMEDMFSGDSGLRDLSALNDWNTTNVKDADGMFGGLPSTIGAQMRIKPNGTKVNGIPLVNNWKIDSTGNVTNYKQLGANYQSPVKPKVTDNIAFELSNGENVGHHSIQGTKGDKETVNDLNKMSGYIPSGYQLQDANSNDSLFTFGNSDGHHVVTVNSINSGNDKVPVDQNPVTSNGDIYLVFDENKVIKVPYSVTSTPSQGVNLLQYMNEYKSGKPNNITELSQVSDGATVIDPQNYNFDGSRGDVGKITNYHVTPMPLTNGGPSTVTNDPLVLYFTDKAGHDNNGSAAQKGHEYQNIRFLYKNGVVGSDMETGKSKGDTINISNSMKNFPSGYQLTSSDASDTSVDDGTTDVNVSPIHVPSDNINIHFSDGNGGNINPNGTKDDTNATHHPKKGGNANSDIKPSDMNIPNGYHIKPGQNPKNDQKGTINIVLDPNAENGTLNYIYRKGDKNITVGYHNINGHFNQSNNITPADAKQLPSDYQLVNPTRNEVTFNQDGVNQQFNIYVEPKQSNSDTSVQFVNIKDNGVVTDNNGKSSIDLGKGNVVSDFAVNKDTLGKYLNNTHYHLVNGQQDIKYDGQIHSVSVAPDQVTEKVNFSDGAENAVKGKANNDLAPTALANNPKAITLTGDYGSTVHISGNQVPQGYSLVDNGSIKLSDGAQNVGVQSDTESSVIRYYSFPKSVYDANGSNNQMAFMKALNNGESTQVGAVTTTGKYGHVLSIPGNFTGGLDKGYSRLNGSSAQQLTYGQDASLPLFVESSSAKTASDNTTFNTVLPSGKSVTPNNDGKIANGKNDSDTPISNNDINSVVPKGYNIVPNSNNGFKYDGHTHNLVVEPESITYGVQFNDNADNVHAKGSDVSGDYNSTVRAEDLGGVPSGYHVVSGQDFKLDNTKGNITKDINITPDQAKDTVIYVDTDNDSSNGKAVGSYITNNGNVAGKNTNITLTNVPDGYNVVSGQQVSYDGQTHVVKVTGTTASSDIPFAVNYRINDKNGKAMHFASKTDHTLVASDVAGSVAPSYSTSIPVAQTNNGNTYILNPSVLPHGNDVIDKGSQPLAITFGANGKIVKVSGPTTSIRPNANNDTSWVFNPIGADGSGTSSTKGYATIYYHLNSDNGSIVNANTKEYDGQDGAAFPANDIASVPSGYSLKGDMPKFEVQNGKIVNVNVVVTKNNDHMSTDSIKKAKLDNTHNFEITQIFENADGSTNHSSTYTVNAFNEGATGDDQDFNVAAPGVSGYTIVEPTVMNHIDGQGRAGNVTFHYIAKASGIDPASGKPNGHKTINFNDQNGHNVTPNVPGSDINNNGGKKGGNIAGNSGDNVNPNKYVPNGYHLAPNNGGNGNNAKFNNNNNSNQNFTFKIVGNGVVGNAHLVLNFFNGNTLDHTVVKDIPISGRVGDSDIQIHPSDFGQTYYGQNSSDKTWSIPFNASDAESNQGDTFRYNVSHEFDYTAKPVDVKVEYTDANNGNKKVDIQDLGQIGLEGQTMDLKKTTSDGSVLINGKNYALKVPSDYHLANSDNKVLLMPNQPEIGAPSMARMGVMLLAMPMTGVRKPVTNVTDHIIFNGDNAGNMTINGKQGSKTSIAAPNGYHFNSGVNNVVIPFDGGTHAFDVTANAQPNNGGNVNPQPSDNNGGGFTPNIDPFPDINPVNPFNPMPNDNGGNSANNPSGPAAPASNGGSAAPSSNGGNGDIVVPNRHSHKRGHNASNNANHYVPRRDHAKNRVRPQRQGSYRGNIKASNVKALNKMGVNDFVTIGHGKNKVQVRRISVPKHYRYFYVARKCLAHRNIATIGTHKNYGFVLRPGHTITKYIQRIFNIKTRHGHKLVRYEFTIGKGRHAHTYFVTGNHHFIRNSYLQKNDFRHVRRHAKKIGRVKVVNHCGLYKSRVYNSKTHIRSLKPGTVLKVRRIIYLGRKSNYQTRLQLTNGKFVTANKNFVKVIK